MASTVQEVIKSRLAQYSLELSTVEMDAIIVDADLDGSVLYTKAQTTPVKMAMIMALSTVLAKPDVTEGDMSIKWDRSAVQVYLNQLLEETGVTSSSQPTVTDRSNVW
jgi:hypothetical protein